MGRMLAREEGSTLLSFDLSLTNLIQEAEETLEPVSVLIISLPVRLMLTSPPSAKPSTSKRTYFAICEPQATASQLASKILPMRSQASQIPSLFHNSFDEYTNTCVRNDAVIAADD